MFAYCLQELALLRGGGLQAHIHAARTARSFPEIFVALADGRLHLRRSDLVGAASDRRDGGRSPGGGCPPEQVGDRTTASRAVPEARPPDAAGSQGSTPSQALLTEQHAPGRVVAPGPTPSIDRGTFEPVAARPKVSLRAPEALRAATHREPEHSRQAPLRTGLAQPPGPERRARTGPRPRSRRPHLQAREAQVRSDQATALLPAALEPQRPAHPGPRQARGMATRSRPMHVRQ